MGREKRAPKTTPVRVESPRVDGGCVEAGNEGAENALPRRPPPTEEH